MQTFQSWSRILIALLPLATACSATPTSTEEQRSTASKWSKDAKFNGPNGGVFDEEYVYCKGWLNPSSQTRAEDCKNFDENDPKHKQDTPKDTIFTGEGDRGGGWTSSSDQRTEAGSEQAERGGLSNWGGEETGRSSEPDNGGWGSWGEESGRSSEPDNGGWGSWGEETGSGESGSGSDGWSD